MVHQMFSLVMQQGLSECVVWQDQTFALKETWNDAIKRENVNMVKNYKKIIQIFMLMWINRMLKPQNACLMEKELWWQSSFTVKNNNNNTKIKQKQKARKKQEMSKKRYHSYFCLCIFQELNMSVYPIKFILGLFQQMAL